jgi:hypothetical protein
MYLDRYSEDNFQRFHPARKKFTKSQVKLINKFRMLWEEHDVWTRSTIVSITFSLPDLDFVIRRLLRNPVDFGRVFAFFFGPRIGAEFARLLEIHLVLAAELVEAGKARDTAAVAEIERKWYANADEIAAFLGRINPFWSEEEWKEMLHEHLALVNDEEVYYLTGNYAAGVAIYDEVERQTLEMADMIAFGIFKQFPEQFTE